MNLILLTHAPVVFYLGVFLDLWRECFHVSASCGFGNLLGGDKKQVTNTWDYANSFNTSTSWASSFTGGDTSLNLGGGSEGTGQMLGNLIPLVLAVFAGLAALFILTRRA